MVEVVYRSCVGRRVRDNEKPKKITKPELDGDTYLIAQAVNHNAELLESALNRIEKLEKGERKEDTMQQAPEGKQISKGQT